jgi:transcription-repair coupling factor (superfamily II helicase)
MAKQINAVAATREGPSSTPHGVYEKFCARFPYGETEDQEKAIGDVMEDLAKGFDGPPSHGDRFQQDRGGAANTFMMR